MDIQAFSVGDVSQTLVLHLELPSASAASAPLWEMKRGLGGMTARGGATVSPSMWSGGLMLTAHAQNYSEPRPEYTRCTPCPLTLFNWVKLHRMSAM